MHTTITTEIAPTTTITADTVPSTTTTRTHGTSTMTAELHPGRELHATTVRTDMFTATTNAESPTQIIQKGPTSTANLFQVATTETINVNSVQTSYTKKLTLSKYTLLKSISMF